MCLNTIIYGCCVLQAAMSQDLWSPPPKQGLYDPALEKDACGVGFIVSIDGTRSHKVRKRIHLSILFKRL